jgi:hypothetical protein
MDIVIHSAPWRPWMKSSIVPAALLPKWHDALASMDEVIYSAPWRPWQKSAIVPAALLQRNGNTSPSQIGTPIYFSAFLLQVIAFSALLLFNPDYPLTDFPCSFACAGGFEMDKDSSPKLNASLHETHLKRTKNLPQPKRQRQPLQPPQPRRRRLWWPAHWQQAASSLQSWLKCLHWVYRDRIQWQIIIQGPTNKRGICHLPAKKMHMQNGTVTKTHDLIAWIRYMNSWYELIPWWIHTMNSYTMH